MCSSCLPSALQSSGVHLHNRRCQIIVFYSGEGSKSNPEITLGDKANIMLTFHDMRKKGTLDPTGRFKAIKKARKRKKR